MKKWPIYLKLTHWALFALAGLLFWGCAHHKPLPRESYQWAYQPSTAAGDDIARWAPTFVVYGHQQTYNRIGRPQAIPTNGGEHNIIIDTQTPVLYHMRRTFQTEKAAYTNLIYRAHFPKIPFSLIPFNVSAGKNIGLLVVVTLDADKRPILVTTVHTCGCYKAIVPTQYLPKTALPENWPSDTLTVYGEHLPARLDFNQTATPRILVHLRPEVHRVMDLEVLDGRTVADGPRFHRIATAMAPMADLMRLPTNGTVTSLFHAEGTMKGYVKGAVKPLESIFLSLISLDFFVGTDKAYADPAVTGNSFYTSLKPWRREVSDMWDFAGFLRYWGWRL